jgi:DNA-binding protein H-NS
MKPNDLNLMSTDELWALHLKVAAVLARRISAEKRQLEQRLQKLQLVSNGSIPRERRPYPQVFPKYRNPENPSETWAGRGKQPRWLKAKLQLGKEIDDFRIRNAGHRATRRSLKRR